MATVVTGKVAAVRELLGALLLEPADRVGEAPLVICEAVGSSVLHQYPYNYDMLTDQQVPLPGRSTP